MIQTDQLRQLARKLRDKTRAKEVNWIPDEEDADDHGCAVLLKSSAVRITHRSPLAKPDEIIFEVSELTRYGDKLPVGSFSAQEPDEGDADENANDWNLLHELYLEASKVAYHWDVVLSEVEAAINGTGRIGRDHDDTATSERGGGLVGPSRSQGGIR